MHRIPLLILFLKTVHSFCTIPNHVYTGAISQTIYGIDWLSCLEACSDRGSCISYNYKQNLHREEKNSICQLFDRSDYGTCGSKEITSSLVYATGFIFHQIRTDNKVGTVLVKCYSVGAAISPGVCMSVDFRLADISCSRDYYNDYYLEI